MTAESGGIPEDLATNSGSTEKTDDVVITSVESRIPLRSEVIQKHGYALEKNYYEEGDGKNIPVEIIYVNNGERTKLQDLLDTPEATFIENNTAATCSVNPDKNVITIPRSVPVHADQTDYLGLQITNDSFVESAQLPSGWIIEGHNYLALEGSLVWIAHETGHIEDEKQHPDQKTSRVKLREKVHSPEYDPSSEENIREYIQTIGALETGAWMEADKKIFNALKKGKDITDGITLTKLIGIYDRCLETYIDKFEKMEKAASQKNVQPSSQEQ